MKTATRSLRFFQPAKLAALAIALVCGLSVASARAGYIVTLQQVGPNVVATGSGAFDLTGLTFGGPDLLGPGVRPNFPAVGVGSPPVVAVDDYFANAPFAGPANFGSGTGTSPDSGSGDPVAIFPNVGGSSGLLLVPPGYLSGPISDSMTFNNQTFSSLGVTPGTYTWSWGAGADQNFTLIAVPDSGSTFGLLALALAALFGASRLRFLQLA